MSLIIAIIHEYLTIYKILFIIAIDFKHNFTVLTNTVLLKVVIMLNFFLLTLNLLH